MKNYSAEEDSDSLSGSQKEEEEDSLVREDQDEEPLEQNNPDLFVKDYGKSLFKNMEKMEIYRHIDRVDQLQRKRSKR